MFLNIIINFKFVQEKRLEIAVTTLCIVFGNKQATTNIIPLQRKVKKKIPRNFDLFCVDNNPIIKKINSVETQRNINEGTAVCLCAYAMNCSCVIF